MKAEIKVIYTSEVKITKTGKEYVKVMCVITLGDNEFVKEFFVFAK